MKMLDTLALTLHRSVCSDPEAQWADLSQEERDDAVQWARDAVRCLDGIVQSMDESEAASIFLDALIDE